MGIAENFLKLRQDIPVNVNIVAVSKTMPVEKILEAYHAGHKVFGENKAQEMADKQKVLPHDIQWHFIGHLQTNKVKYIIPFVHLIHSVDSTKLLEVVDTEAKKQGRVADYLLQIKIAKESTKFGMQINETRQFLDSPAFKKFENTRLVGVMGMATFTDDTEQIRSEFNFLVTCFRDIKNSWFTNNNAFKELSIGMSGDYKIAIEAGATIVRIGSLIFGERIYP